MTGKGRFHLLRQGMALTVGTMVQAVIGLIAQIVLMRILLPEDFGKFVMVLAGCGLMQTILSLRVNVLIIRLPDDERDGEQARLYQAALLWETLAAAIAALVWLVLADLASGPALILLISLTLGQWVNQITSFYERGMNYSRITLVETMSQLLGHAGAIVLVLAGAGAISLYLRELLVICCRMGAYAAIGALPRPLWVRPSLADCRRIWHEARGVWAEGILEGIFARLIILTSGTLAGLHGAGLFAQSHRLAMLPHQFLSPVISRMSANLFSRTENPHRRHVLALHLSLAAMVILLPGVAIIWLWAPQLVPWLFGDKWRDAGTVLQAMIGVILFLSLFDLLRSFCYSHKWVKPVLWGRVVQIALFVLPATYYSLSDVEDLAWVLSAAYTGGFVVLLFTTLRMLATPRPTD